MQRRSLGGLEVSAVGLGCATMTPFYDEPDGDAAIDTLRHAREIGVDFLDSSDAYGQGRNEELIACAIKGHRDDYVIATKFGNLRAPDGSPTSDGRPEYVKACCERSLKRLQTDIIDLYYIHRVDPTVPIEDTMGAMGELVRQGKVRHLGICEAGAATIRRAHATHPLSAVQIEYSLWTRDVEAEILPLCKELGIGFVAYCPLGRGFFDRQSHRYRGAARGRCTAEHTAVSARQSAPQPRAGRGAEETCRSREMHSGAARDRLGLVAGAPYRADFRDQPSPPARRKR
jgi:aryl-alcohol dehydrogenase-like predicted oxidoreductase